LNNYIDDVEITRVLLRDKETPNGLDEDGKPKPPKASEELGEMYLMMIEKILSRGNFRGYTEEYKNEMRGMAHIFFARYWWKFSPEKVQFNVLFNDSVKSFKLHEGISDDIEVFFKDLPDEYKILKPREEWKGVFSFFSTLIFSAFLGGLKNLNKSKPYIEDAKQRTDSASEDIASEYYSRGLGQEFDL